MKTAEIKELYVINSKELQKRIEHLEKLRISRNNTSEDLDFFEIKLLKNIQQSLSPLKGVLKKAFNAGSNIPSHEEMTLQECSDAYDWCLKDFLNKPIEL